MWVETRFEYSLCTVSCWTYSKKCSNIPPPTPGCIAGLVSRLPIGRHSGIANLAILLHSLEIVSHLMLVQCTVDIVLAPVQILSSYHTIFTNTYKCFLCYTYGYEYRVFLYTLIIIALLSHLFIEHCVVLCSTTNHR